VAHAGNPLNAGSEAITGVDVDLGTVPARTVQISGEVSCDDCEGGAVIFVYGPGGAENGSLTSAAALDGPGPYSIKITVGAGEVHVYAKRDADGDGQADADAKLVAHEGNPLSVAEEDLSGVDVDLGAREPVTVKIEGTVTCADCGGVSVAAYGAGGREGGVLLATQSLEAPGAYTLEVPVGVGEAHVLAWRDEDLDGEPDPGAEPAAHAENPLTVAGEDLQGVDVAITGLPVTSVRISGEVVCGDCPGMVRVELYLDGGMEAGSLLDALSLDAPGEWSLKVAANLGEVFVYAFRDEDNDSAPDPGTEVASYASNPLAVAGQDIEGVSLNLGDLPDLTVELKGVVHCTTCAGGAVVEVYASGGLAEGLVLATVALDSPGDFALDVASGSGKTWLYGFQDEDRDGEPDEGAVRVPFPDNPVQVGVEDISGLEVDLLDIPLPDAGGEDADAGVVDGGGDPGVEDPGAADPGVEDPGVADPGVEDPGAADPGVEDPGGGDPIDEDPGEADPGDEDPGEADPGDEDPGEADPGEGADPGIEADAPAPDAGGADMGPAEDLPDAAPAPDDPGEPKAAARCGCRLGPSADPPLASLLALLAGAWLLRARRKRRSAS
jgi:hypothetical protein